jgi:putative transposase
MKSKRLPSCTPHADSRESLATVRARTDKTRGCLSRVTMLAMVFKLYQSAAKWWHRLRAAHYLPAVMNGIVFKDGLRVAQDAACG